MELPLLKIIKAEAVVYWHVLPYLLLVCVIGRIVLFCILGLHTEVPNPSLSFHLWIIIKSIAVGIGFGIAVGIAFGIGFGIAVGIAFGIGFGIAVGIAFGIAFIIAFSIAFGIGFGIAVGIAADLAVAIGVGDVKVIVASTGIRMLIGVGGMLIGLSALDLAFGIDVGIAFGNDEGTVFGIAVGTPLILVGLYRLYYLPLHLALRWPGLQMRWVRLHPALWDDLCLFTFYGFHRMLVRNAIGSRWRGKYEIERIIKHYPAQQIEGLKAKTIMLARQMGNANNLAQIGRLAARLPEGENGFLSQTALIRESIEKIVQHQTRLDAINRPFFRQQSAERLCDEIQNFQVRIAGYHEPLNSEFRAAAGKWLQVAQRELNEARLIISKQPTAQVFRAGDPVQRAQEAFTPRFSVVGELEQQVMLSTGCPGIVLYGRRRTGKSTILRNLNGFIPPNVVPTFFSMQDAELFSSLGSFTGALARGIQNKLASAIHDTESVNGLQELNGFLKRSNEYLEKEGGRLLLIIDEYETLDRLIGEGVFPLYLLDLVRESIQTHRRITWIFAGSHEITELAKAPWTSYLVSARTVTVPMFTPAETRVLLTEPLMYSPDLKDNPKRPHFDASFWGQGGIERIHTEAGGWPHLVQLLAEVLVDLVNDDKASIITAKLMDQAFEKATERGHNVLYELMCRESTVAGEWEYLSEFRRVEEQALPVDEKIAFSLRRRKLIEESNGCWRLRVPLMARWLKLRG
jgi:hypothetical protein